jgi:hypothetical protein
VLLGAVAGLAAHPTYPTQFGAGEPGSSDTLPWVASLLGLAGGGVALVGDWQRRRENALSVRLSAPPGASG